MVTAEGVAHAHHSERRQADVTPGPRGWPLGRLNDRGTSTTGVGADPLAGAGAGAAVKPGASGLAGGDGQEDPEVAILALLRLRFTDPEDPAALARRDALLRWFSVVPNDQATRLLTRLNRPPPGDELAVRFGRQLATPTRRRLIAILAAKADEYRGTHDRQNRAAALFMQARAAQDPRRDPRYIDNLARSIEAQPFMDALQVNWTTGGRPQTIVIPVSMFRAGPIKTFWQDETVYATVGEAQAAVAVNRASVPRGSIDAFWSYYQGPDGVILPTLYCVESAPRIMAHALDVNRAGARAAASLIMPLAHVMANVVNPIPLTSVDERGDLHLQIDAQSLTSALLHLQSIKTLGKPVGGGTGDAGGGVRIPLTPREAALIRKLQGILKEGGSWNDMAVHERASLGTLFHKEVEDLTAYIFRGVGRVRQRVEITPSVLTGEAKSGGRLLIVEGGVRVGQRMLRVDLLEIDFAKLKALVVDLTSVSRDAHVAKTREYGRILAELLGFPVAAIEMRYVGLEGVLRQVLSKAVIKPD